MDNQELDLFKDWQKIKEEKFSLQTIKKQEIMDAIHKDSNSTINTLKKNLKYKMMWSFGFIVCFTIWMLFSLDRPELLMIVGALNLSYIIGFILLSFKYRKMDSELDFTQNSLITMKKNLNLITGALKIEQNWGLFTLPSAIIIGILVSRHYNGYTILETITDSTYLLKIIILLIILVPIAFISTNKMNKSAFGKQLDKLRDNISKLELIQ